MSVYKVAIDTGPLESGHSFRGIGFHTKRLIEEFNRLKEENINIDAVNFKKANLSKYDLVHYPAFNPFVLSLPEVFPTKAVVTIHDCIYLLYPRAYPPGLRGKMVFIKQRNRLKKAQGIITISETSKKDIIRFLDVKPDKVHVIYLGPSSLSKPVTDKKKLEQVRNKYNLPKRFVLYVGDVNFNKNIPTLIKACGKINIPLVIVGKQAFDIEGMGMDLTGVKGPRDWIRFLFNKPHPELAHYHALLYEFKVNRHILRLGFVSDYDLAVIYNLAAVYCQPSFYEGFGLPVLEAMACGTPVVASKIQAHKEIAGEAVVYADANSYQDMAEKLDMVIKDSDLRQTLKKKSIERAKDFSWQKTAEETIDIYNKILSE